MLTATIGTLLSATGGELLAGAHSTVFNGVEIDSRADVSGRLFVAFAGEHLDGHDFVADALRRGAHAVLVSRNTESLGDEIALAEETGAAIVRVDDPTKAVQELARYYRARLRLHVIGITGSTGKTSTKDFLAAVLSTRFKVDSSEGNRNNELGLPLTVLSTRPNADVLIVEMAMRGLGQIRDLCSIAHPSMGLITNVGSSHIEVLGSQDAIAEAKSELIKCLPEDGTAFLNGDDAYSEALAQTTDAKVVRYGLSASCDVRAEAIELDELSRPSFTLITPAGSAAVSLPVSGRHNVYNALAAAAVAIELGLDPSTIAEGLASAALTRMRMEVMTTAGGITVINDAYNASPASMRAAVETLALMATDGQRIAVLGDMAELGSLAELAHFEIGELVAELGLDALVTVGPRAARIAAGAQAAGMPKDRIVKCETAPQAAEEVTRSIEAGDAVLVKASRVMGLERVVEGIVSAL
ncbi:MAG: UDP-N-acetylmuramoyl-tripeptide--D-alanyl-D-alanine ligase [Coriobacteriia bacterium]